MQSTMSWNADFSTTHSGIERNTLVNFEEELDDNQSIGWHQVWNGIPRRFGGHQRPTIYIDGGGNEPALKYSQTGIHKLQLMIFNPQSSGEEFQTTEPQEKNTIDL